MNHELALKLKETGFPQNLQACRVYFHYLNDDEVKIIDFRKTLDDLPIGEIAVIPTLSEIIEACGEKFDHIQKSKDQHVKWRARAWVGTMPIVEFGDTMEEAVAKLWLVLNK